MENIPIELVVVFGMLVAFAQGYFWGRYYEKIKPSNKSTDLWCAVYRVPIPNTTTSGSVVKARLIADMETKKNGEDNE